MNLQRHQFALKWIIASLVLVSGPRILFGQTTQQADDLKSLRAELAGLRKDVDDLKLEIAILKCAVSATASKADTSGGQLDEPIPAAYSPTFVKKVTSDQYLR